MPDEHDISSPDRQRNDIISKKTVNFAIEADGSPATGFAGSAWDDQRVVILTQRFTPELVQLAI